MCVLKNYIKSKNQTQKDFANSIDVNPVHFNKVVNGKYKLTEDMIDKIDRVYKDFKQYLETIYDKKLLSEIVIKEPKTIYEAKHGKKIPFYNTEVFATISPAMADVVALNPDTFIRIPIFAQGEFALQVTGNSMKGLINHGDWIVVKQITNQSAIIYGEIYLIVTKSDNLKTVKFVKEHNNKNLLWLIPYNIEQFQAQTIEKREILEMYKISGLFRSV